MGCSHDYGSLHLARNSGSGICGWRWCRLEPQNAEIRQKLAEASTVGLRFWTVTLSRNERNPKLFLLFFPFFNFSILTCSLMKLAKFPVCPCRFIGRCCRIHRQRSWQMLWGSWDATGYWTTLWKNGCFLKGGNPQIIHFNGIFHYKPSIWGYPHLWKPPKNPISLVTKPTHMGLSQKQGIQKGRWIGDDSHSKPIWGVPHFETHSYLENFGNRSILPQFLVGCIYYKGDGIISLEHHDSQTQRFHEQWVERRTWWNTSMWGFVWT